MNPDQLWETTLDSNVRSLLRVKVSELDEADDILTKLMATRWSQDGISSGRTH